MTERISLAGSDWTFAGFHGEDWRWRSAFKRDTGAKGWMPATVPGSVHWDLLKVGEIPDPYFERNSRLVEWVHQRQWVYKREFTVPATWTGQRLFLQFDGVDYAAEFYLDGELIGQHESMFIPALFEITEKAQPGESHHLAVVLKDAPREWPQLGRTSTVESIKARFGYWWDFATRLVHLGIWQDVSLFATGPARIADAWVRPTLTADQARAEVVVVVALDAPAEAVTVELFDPEGSRIASATGTADDRFAFTVEHPALWWPNGMGSQPLYRCQVTVGDSDSRSIRFGIRQFSLEQNVGASRDALPYTFTVNGCSFYAKGYNWVPVDHLYGRADLTEKYRQLVALMQASHVNLVRVWGGGLLERELFYDLCDRAGILVWQEFWQSSSGTDNVPNADPAYMARLKAEAEQAIPLRRNHPSLALWCGGNELTDWEKNPASVDDPVLAMLADVVRAVDPDRPYLPTSPSGPLFGTSDNPAPELLAMQHDVHGPWHYRGPVDSYLPYNHSNALFHSEFGTQGALAKASLDRIMSPANQWPPNDTNPLWVHHGGWWMQQHRVKELFGDVEGIERYLPLSQFLQTENLRYGVESNRRRWPHCSGSIIWQFDEPWPNSQCTTLVDYFLRPKMAYYYVKAAYAPVACSLKYEGPIVADNTLKATPYVAADRPLTGSLRITLTDVSGKVWHSTEQTVSVADGPERMGGVAELAPVHWVYPEGCPDVLICTLTLFEDGVAMQRNPYLFSRAAAPIFSSLIQLPAVRLDVRQEGH
ncbi:MAG: glycoside hydrolase family 2 protein, partial [Mycobacterium leprae]